MNFLKNGSSLKNSSTKSGYNMIKNIDTNSKKESECKTAIKKSVNSDEKL